MKRIKRYKSKIDKNKNIFIAIKRKNIPWLDGRQPNWIKEFIKHSK